jgi:hypothetical protein
MLLIDIIKGFDKKLANIIDKQDSIEKSIIMSADKLEKSKNATQIEEIKKSMTDLQKSVDILNSENMLLKSQNTDLEKSNAQMKDLLGRPARARESIDAVNYIQKSAEVDAAKKLEEIKKADTVFNFNNLGAVADKVRELHKSMPNVITDNDMQEVVDACLAPTGTAQPISQKIRMVILESLKK